ncbi:MAG: DUF4416 family protein [Elusimicrobia bacterium]|nr:DUF4416 family protein [Candidatus Liberimonas magnetica]
MGRITTYKPVKLFIGMISRSKDLIEKTEPFLISNWGTMDIKSPVVPFDFTDYYAKEMGTGLLRQWVGFEKLIEQEELSNVKTETNNIENNFLNSSNRQINLDPGYLALSKIVLASTKDYSHRIYLKNGIHAEITMIYQNKQFTHLPWTYPDYKSAAAAKFFVDLRQIYTGQM